MSQHYANFLQYDRATGQFRWTSPTTNSVAAGDIAGRINTNGHRQITINGEVILAHRLAWLFVHGEWPASSIDHINCRRDDNRIENLRLCTLSQNNANTVMRKSNKSGIKGVRWYARNGKWNAQIGVRGKKINLGYYDDKQAAAEAYRRCAVAEFGEFARLA